ncbi:hypothetical protein POTOM_038710 [Populus tomentosa]|uniref:F-box associated domain-containing protein n=1 Tax=Populus tomentosa TaxID=118781 RepID=A0A8X7Z7M3_POPTO|nr:hypothetical protein POTOM_038710 [Populus tomentosa]
MAESVKKNRVPEDVDKDFISAYLAQAKPSLLLRRWQNRQESYSLHLDNKSLDRSLQFQNLPFRIEADCFDIIALPKLCGPHSAAWGFGFDLPSKDYRVVGVARQVSSKREFPMEFQVAFNGILHWLVYREENDNRRSSVLSFDSSNDKFGEIMLRMATQWMVISEFDDSLAALFYRAMVFRKNGEILMRKHGSYESVSLLNESKEIDSGEKRRSKRSERKDLRPSPLFLPPFPFFFLDINHQENTHSSVPECFDTKRIIAGMSISVSNNSLTVNFYGYLDGSLNFEIWMMNQYGVRESWALQCRIHEEFPLPYFRLS